MQKANIDPEDLIALVADGWTTPQLAEHYRVNRATIQRRRKQLGISAPGKTLYDRDAVKALAEQGHTNAEIAERIGCHIDSISRIRHELGLHHPKRPNSPWTEERKQRIAGMIADGWPRAEIARTEGVDPKTIEKYFPGTAWTEQQRAEHMATVARMNHYNRRPRHYDASKYRAAA